LSSDSERLLYARAGESLAELEAPNPYAGLEGINPGIWNQAVVGVLRELCGAIMEQRPLREGATFLDGLRNQQALDAIRQSEATRRWVELPA
jgi:predicted dehydrogenase